MYFFVDKKKTPFFLNQKRELLTISSSCSSKYGRELTIKKKGWNSSKLQSAFPSVSKENFLSHSLGKGKNRAPDYLLFLFGRWKRAYAPEESMEFPRPAKRKSGPPPSPAFQKEKRNTLLHAPIPVARRDFQLSSIADSAWLIPSSFPATMLWKTFNRKESPPHVFSALML